MKLLFNLLYRNLKRCIFRLLIRHYFPCDLSIISSNCIGTRLYQSADKKYLSPTINLWMPPADFLKFSCNLEFYIQQELKINNNKQFQYPCGRLGDITLHFQHYKNFEVAKKKWDERKDRINWDKILFIFTDRDGATIDSLVKMADVSKNVFVFCSSKKRNSIKRHENIIFIRSKEISIGDLYTNYDELLFKFPFIRFSKI
ncbi:DUF1919 domain-containing protein [Escherichia coli O79:H28]|uniref:DUF1919 domain-containing protein n=1 Tax=Escherichia coli TaxID=562 RepID=UPI000A36A22B|nr:DUF1919 domain-containing protein [Escherichia coli]EEZ6550672.1 DUF1919 domain-containing protein [Escherichia coli]EFL6181996.1 DUF1919 domain-containing protein [Escherichia coli]EFL6322717.1 DUF1919 domain-containing protein [Escherichia coli]EGF1381183.1 DUF1919 domain-containing protein [Escherichia coli]EGS9739792.1 DUF1919 domain-containing protein [Escherichia coli]